MTIDTGTLDMIAAASGRNEKLRLMRELPDDGTTRSFFRLALDPVVKFGVTADVGELIHTWESFCPRPPYDVRFLPDRWWDELVWLMQRLQARELTGGSASRALVDLFQRAPEVACVVWGARAINKDLRSGVGVETANRVWPGLIDDLSVQLAVPYEPERHELRGWWAIEPKLDGYRMVVVDGVGYTRNKRRFTTVDGILGTIPADTLEAFVIDGEVMGGGADFDESGGRLRRKGEDDAGALYHIFDVVPRERWGDPTYDVPLSARRAAVESVAAVTVATAGAGGRRVLAVEQIRILDPTPEQLMAARDSFIRDGYEGAMAKDMSAPYEYRRTDRVLKLKDFVSADVPIVGFKEGRGKLRGSLGAIVVAGPGGVETSVGSGFDEATRAEIWGARETYLGSTVEVLYQNLTRDGRMRFPRFMRMRGDR